MSNRNNPFSLRSFFSFGPKVKLEKTVRPQSPLPSSNFESLTADIDSGFELGSLNAARIREALNEGKAGKPGGQVSLVEELLEREGQTAAHLQTRMMSISGKNWSVTSKNYPEIAEEAQKMLSNANLQGLISHLCYTVLYGYSGAIIDWKVGGSEISGFKPIRPSCLEFDPTGQFLVLDNEYHPHPLNEFADSQFIMVSCGSGVGVPSRNGICRTLLWLYLMKKIGMTGWSRFVEKYGMPLLLGKLPAGAQRDQVNGLLSALQKMSRDGIGVMTGSETNIDTVESSKNGGDQEKFCRYIDEMITLVILGQLATSDTAKGFSNGDIQNRVRQDLIAADATLIINAIQNQVLNPWLNMRYGLTHSEHNITFWIDYAPAEDLISKADLCLKITAATGCKLDKGWAEEQFGVKLSSEIN